LVEVISDTSFLILLATNRIKNLDNLDTEIGQIRFVVPEIVRNELKILCDDPTKKEIALTTLDYIKNLKIIPITGKIADDAIIDYVKNYGGIVATMDKELKNKIKNHGGSIISLLNNKIILES